MNRNTNTVENLEEPWTKPWPMDGLESVAHCPVCSAADREILHSDLVDIAFRAAPGKWTLWKCANCSSAYLDPRPTPDTIHLAYANYYTHHVAAEKDNYASMSPFRKLRRRLVNGYTNWRYSTCFQPANTLGLLIALAMPGLKKVLDHQYHYIPRLPKGGGRLLDVGCGSGSFLSLARTCGWDVVGLDPDPKAVANAEKQGLTVHEGGIEYFEGKSELFDVIILDHVIEHVHDPVKVLRICYALLMPGGQVWLETPNIDSFGHVRFQKNWRGLETPRHLVLFNRYSLSKAFINAGFPAPIDCMRPSPCVRMFQASFAMEHGHSPYAVLATPKTLQLEATIAIFMETLLPSRREFLSVIAHKKMS